ncbi:MAG: hypothetical protein LBP62_03165 [Clostridiales bacterium]|jgi:Zn-dependent oligopeptidase|nr:hypothetical protein [Clostridiales bacterium]
MEKELIRKALITLAIEYPRDIDIKDESTFNLKVDLWHSYLKDYPQKLIDRAINDSIKTKQFCPHISDIISRAEEYLSATEKSAEQFWTEFCNCLSAASNITFRNLSEFSDFRGVIDNDIITQYKKRVYENMPPILKEFCPSFREFCALQKAEYETLAYEKSRFLKSFDRLKIRVKIKNEISANPLIENFGGLKLLD